MDLQHGEICGSANEIRGEDLLLLLVFVCFNKEESPVRVHSFSV